MILDQLRNQRREFRRMGLVGAILGIGLAPLPYFFLDPPEQNLWAMCLLLVPVGGLLALAGGVGDLQKARPLELLRHRADQIVWMFVQVRSGRGGRTSHVVMGLRDGKRVPLWTKAGTEQDTLAALKQLAPQATTGYSREIEARFRNNPASLVR